MQGADVGVGRGAGGLAGRRDPRQHPGIRSARAHCGDRHGQARRWRARIRIRRRRDVRLRTDRRRRRVGRRALGGQHRRTGADAAGHAQRRPAVGGRREPASRGSQRLAGAHAGVVRGVLRAVGAAMGDSGAVARPPRRRRPGSRPPVPADGRRDPVPAGRGVRRGRAGDPADQGAGRRRAAAARR